MDGHDLPLLGGWYVACIEAGVAALLEETYDAVGEKHLLGD
jgi:hypothetical protein